MRRTHFPPDRNVISAHLTLFHHLPPSVVGELKEHVQYLTKAPPPSATISGIMSLGRGTALRAETPSLAHIRDELADAFAPLLLPQDAQGWRPHVTIQNKVSLEEARKLRQSLTPDFRPRPISIIGIAAWWYRDGPWEFAFGCRFGSGHQMKAPRPFIAG